MVNYILYGMPDDLQYCVALGVQYGMHYGAPYGIAWSIQYGLLYGTLCGIAYVVPCGTLFGIPYDVPWGRHSMCSFFHPLTVLVSSTRTHPQSNIFQTLKTDSCCAGQRSR